MIFEDFIMLLLQAIVVLHVFSVPEVSSKFFADGTFLKSMATTLLSVYRTLSSLFSDSNALQENRFEYLLTCLKAK